MNKKTIKLNKEANYLNEIKFLIGITYFLDDNVSKKLTKPTNYSNRISILERFDKFSDSEKKKFQFSTDKLTKSLQNAIKKKIQKINRIDNIFFIRDRMLDDIRNICNLFFKKDNICLQKITNKLDNLIIPYIFYKSKIISYSTNDNTLFNNYCNDSDNSKYQIINLNKEYKINKIENIIYYLDNIDSIDNLNFLKEKNCNFIIDLKSTIHNLNDIRIISLNSYKLEQECFDIFNIFKTWSTLLYLGFNNF